ncbi:hypothetical protein LTR08_007842 [Meristemomyces frigidus]|nr:hypothetical protein LTR08_007842 [Meristemomyces frigidus]
MDNSPLARLAPELKNAIYELALYDANEIPLCAEKGSLASPSKQGSTASALTMTCKEIRAETTAMFYAVNTFTLYSGSDSTGLGHWSKNFGNEYKQVLRACARWLKKRPQSLQAIRLVIAHSGGDVWTECKRPAYWWKDTRKAEKAILHQVIDASKIYVRFSMVCYDSGVTYHTSTDSGEHTCHLDVLRECSVMTYELPTNAKTLALAVAEKALQAKARQIEECAKLYACCVGAKLPQLRAGLQKSHAAVLRL